MRINVIDGFSDNIERLHAALDASCVVGIWDWDHVRGVVVYDAGAAKLLTGDSECADREINGFASVSAVHPADREWLAEHMIRAARAGGLVLAEYRTVAEDGEIRWLLSRGRTYLDQDGAPAHTRGILIDITEMRDGGERYVLGQNSSAADPLERAAELSVALKQSLDADAPSEVRLLVDLLLMRLGHAIATDAGET